MINVLVQVAKREELLFIMNLSASISRIKTRDSHQ